MQTTNAPTLTMVYNARSGIGHALFDAAHKLLRPATYPCSLCAITYGAVAMRREWQEGLAGLPYRTRFLHADEWRAATPGDTTRLPAVFRDGHVLLDSPAIDACADVPALLDALRAALARAEAQPG